MCGINVIVDKTRGRFGPEAIQRMNAALRHRGPDGEPHYERIDLDWATVWLGATRLALRGGTSGEQPMHSHSGRFTLVYNGEIYNLAHQGGSDTAELAAWLEANIGNPEAGLNGMYAFVFVDRESETVQISRDLTGIKPLFFSLIPGGYALSSEPEALLQIGAWPGFVADRNAGPPLPEAKFVDTWLSYRYPGQGNSLFGEDSLATDEMLWQNLDFRHFGRHSPYPVSKPDDLQLLMLEVLERQLVSDRPVGLMLSGGYDSAFLLACLATSGRKLPCYTLAGTPDAEPAARMAAKLGFGHRLVLMPTGWQDLEQYMQGKLHPIADSGGFATWLVARQAKADGVPVLLSGAGADELLGGYRRHKALHWLQRLSMGLLDVNRQAALFNWMLAWNGLGHLSRTKGNMLGKLIYPPSKKTYDPRYHDLYGYLSGDVLMVTDQATMAHGVEARVPYLDNEVVARLMGIPWTKLMAAGYKAPLVPALKEAGLFDLLLKKKTGFGLWDTAIFEGLPVVERLREPGHILYQYLDFSRVQNELRNGTPHAWFSICQLAYTLEFIQEWRPPLS